ncbi:hypothetical protein PF005_g14805 [Phytophthora fragariae]|uniref:Uncharacterized protein n=1 Tax=Phytophthora fragariae TaxID=53985 RepID=A0A6A3RYF6_9STRA|nr:hypothetical protein PF003_g32861 [Phytophthora fragariae]KAE8933865.1 hypothetical protein PF009_g16141 [Phytophthora fragariae]KAE9001575.1 hypothetical protein PF011_g13686 [Phytophthora fragariae]KAE9098121.1 hypothetical protein PF010_g15683 [Phytophthora fragariae]KAE9102445.1 hypothetical protein PF007_g14763 [Phytophthora fragariae]
MTSTASTRPHAFGRSSNVWQYLDFVQDRKTPPSDDRTLSAFAESSDDGYSDDGKLAPTSDGGNGDGAVRPEARQRGSQVSIAGATKRHSNAQKGSSSVIPNMASLPDLHHAGKLREASRRTLVVSASSPYTLVGAGLRVVGGSGFNSAEIMKRLNALGTLASTPLLPASSTNNLHAIESATTQTQQPGQGVGTPLQLATPGVVGPGVTSAGAVVVPVSDAQKLRNDFNSQATRLSYGCSVALELFNGHLMMVSSPDGQARVQSLEKLQMQTKGYKDRAVFTLLDLADVRSASSIRYGDSVWLQLSVGPGDVSWEQGGVLGAKVREAPQLKALGLLDDDAIRNDVQAPTSVGYPVPVTAYLPKSRDDGDLQVDEIQSRLRNKSAKMLGKWTIRSAVSQRRKQKDNFVYNNDEVYLEQDWFYLGADSDAGMAVLRQLPPAVAGKDIKPGDYVVERRGAWKLRLLDSSSGGAGLSLAQQQMERLLLRAKAQLKQSQRMRAGQTKVYGPNLRGGTGFTAQLRAQVAASTRQTESRYTERQELRLKRIDRHMREKARSMNVGIRFEDTLDIDGGTGRSGMLESSRRTSIRRDSALVGEGRKRSLLRSSSVEIIATSRRQSLAGSDKSGASKETTDGRMSSSRSTSSLPEPTTSCGLCHSSSIGYNLCCQFRDVMRMLEQERLLDTTASGADTQQEGAFAAQNYGESASLPGSRRTARSRATRSAGVENGVAGASAIPPQDAASSRDSTIHGGVESGRGSTPSAALLNERVLQLFAKEDAAMVDIIKYKEKEAYRALYAETQARVGLSPVAAHFRDRFKHVGLIMQMHKQHQQAQQDGISGHFQKLHADLYSANSKNRPTGRSANADEDDYDSDYDSNDDYDDDLDGVVDAPVQPPESLQVSTDPQSGRKQSEESVAAPDMDRIFPTSEELEQLTPVDTKSALALYVQNRTAMGEMLDGYAELVDTQMIPTLKNSLSTRNRGALVEALDFVARASEFVCARRVQVSVAKLLHAVSESDVGDFSSFQKEFDKLVIELQGAVNFIRFFLQTRATRRKNKETKRMEIR